MNPVAIVDPNVTGFIMKMSSCFRYVMIRILLVLSLLCSAAAFGLDTRKSGKVNQVGGNGDVVQRAVNFINKKHKGQVLSAKPVQSSQGLKVRVKFLSEDGVIKILFVTPD